MITDILQDELPAPVNDIDPELIYESSRAALSVLETEASRFPQALQDAVQAGAVDLILSLRRRRLEAEIELEAARLMVARDLVLLYEWRSVSAIASVAAAHIPLARAQSRLAEAQAEHSAAQNHYQQAVSDRDFSAFDLRQARGEFAKLSAEQTRTATQAALRQRL